LGGQEGPFPDWQKQFLYLRFRFRFQFSVAWDPAMAMDSICTYTCRPAVERIKYYDQDTMRKIMGAAQDQQEGPSQEGNLDIDGNIGTSAQQ